MKTDIDRLLKQALTPEEEPEQRLNHQILCRAKEMENMKKKVKRIPQAAVILGILLFASVTVFAAWEYLNPSEVAEHFEDPGLAKAFQSETAIVVNETQKFTDYQVTLLGAVTGKELSAGVNTDSGEEFANDRMYTVTAVERVDGTPMAESGDEGYEEEMFRVFPCIEGFQPEEDRMQGMYCGTSSFVEDGVRYYLTGLRNLEVFADRKIYIGVHEKNVYDPDAYLYQEDGTLVRNENYSGVNALFELPLDEEKADPKAAEALLKELDAEREESLENLDTPEQWYKNLTPSNINDYAMPVESTIMICTADAKGKYWYSWEYKERSAYNDIPESSLYNAVPGKLVIMGCSYSENIESMLVETFILNEDGTATFALYEPTEEP